MNIRTAKSIFALCLLTLAARADTNAFYFVQISDTHHGRTLHENRFKDAIGKINALPFDIEVVAHTGDFASDNLERTADAITNLFSTITIAPVICVAGNHDFSDRGKDPKQRTIDCVDVYRKKFGELGAVRETDNALYIAVCTEGLFSDYTDICDFDPIAFLRDALAANTNSKPAFVFTHRPDCDDDFYNNELHESRMNRRDEWRKTLADGKATAVIAGHFHREETHNDAYGVPTYVSGAIAGYWGRQGSFRIYKYKDGRLSYYTTYIEDPEPESEP